MKTCIKKSFVVPVLIAVVAMLVACPSQAQFTYTTNNGTITITRYTGTNDDVVIPSSISGLPVTSIADSAFNSSALTSVTIPDTVTDIGSGAFASCTSLTNITLGSGVMSIGENAFHFCTNLSNVTIPNSVVGFAAFSECYSLTNVTLGNGVTSIGDVAFLHCINLSSVRIPDSVTAIGVGAFLDCHSLTIVTLGSGVTKIGVSAFLNCSSLTNITVDLLNSAYSSVDGVLFDQSQTTLVTYPGGRRGDYTIPNGVTGVGENAFNGCNSLTRLTIPETVTDIGEAAFEECSRLTNLTIGSGVTSIGDFAFSFCTSLSGVTIPDSVTTIGNAAFGACSSMTNIIVDPLNSAYSSVDGVLFDHTQTTLVTCPAGKLGGYTIPNGVASVGFLAFFLCTSLTSVTMPDSVTNVEGRAFASCTSLTNITLGSGVMSIGENAFYFCTNLSNVTIPNSVNSIGDDAFALCYNLTNITLGSGVTSIGDSAFYECYGLMSLYFQGNSPNVGGTIVFYDDTVTIYYLPGTTGWGSTFGGIPTALWLPQVQVTDTSFGVKSNQFGFNVTWASGLSVVVEASPSLSTPVWSPLVTNTLNGGSFYFTDPQWTNYPSRFYRVRSQ